MVGGPGLSFGLTFARLDAIKPSVISVCVAGTSTILKPSTARSATAGSAGFLETAALCARYLIARGDGWRSRIAWCGDCRAGY